MLIHIIESIHIKDISELNKDGFDAVREVFEHAIEYDRGTEIPLPW